MTAKAKAKSTLSVAERLEALANLQKIDSEIDRLVKIRGELPLEIEDLEADIEGLNKRIEKFSNELKDIELEISNRKNEQKEAQAAIISYKEKQNNVRNNREFESISKEIEFQELEIQLHDKKIKESKAQIEHKKETLKEEEEKLANRKQEYEVKKSELDNIIAETESEEEKLLKKSEKARKKLDEYLQTAYDRIRSGAKNGLAVVPVDRDSCGGCFNRIPAQRQLDIVQKKKVIVCENCGRILIPTEVETENE